MKRIFSLILVAVLTLSLASLVACGGDVVDEVSDKASDMMTTTERASTTEDDTSRETTDKVTEDESMTGNVEQDSDGFIENSSSNPAGEDESAAR